MQLDKKISLEGILTFGTNLYISFYIMMSI